MLIRRRSSSPSGSCASNALVSRDLDPDPRRRAGARAGRRPARAAAAPGRARRQHRRLPRHPPVAMWGSTRAAPRCSSSSSRPGSSASTSTTTSGVDGISVLFILLNSFITIAGGDRRLDRDREPRGRSTSRAFLILSGLLNGVFAALDGGAVLRVLRGHADPDVHHHRHLGRAEPRVRGGQVLPLYAVRVAACCWWRCSIFTTSSGGSFAILDWHKLPLTLHRAGAALLRHAVRVRGQGADVAGAHLAARRAHRGAHRRLGGARRDPAEARGLRLRPLHPADPARRLARALLADDRAVARSPWRTSAWWPWCRPT